MLTIYPRGVYYERMTRDTARAHKVNSAKKITQDKNSKKADKPDKIVSNLNRINGQIDGILKMYQSDRSCLDVVRQIAAARSALGSVAREMLNQEACKCSREQDYKELDLVVKELMR